MIGYGKPKCFRSSGSILCVKNNGGVCDFELECKSETYKLFNENEMINICADIGIEVVDRYIEVKYVKELIEMYKYRDSMLWNDERQKYQEKINKKVSWLIRNARTIEEWSTK